MELNDLSSLARSRWAMPLLAAVCDEGGARFVTLVSRLGLSRDTVARTLSHLSALGLVVRNPGHGHPLRPEYVPTPRGSVLGAQCRAVLDARAQLGVAPDGLGRWALPAVHVLGEARARFAGLEVRLRPITPRALSAALDQLLVQHLIDHEVDAGVGWYGLAPRTLALASSLRAGT